MKQQSKILLSNVTAFTLMATLGACGSDSAVSNNSSQASSTASISATLDGAQTVPPVSTLATGTVDVTLNKITGAISGNITHTVTDTTVAHIHSGAAGQTGAPIITLTQNSVTEFVVPESSVLSAEQVIEFTAGNLYVNVHSSTHVAGEIRAQLTEQDVTTSTQATLTSIQATVFTPICSVCHTGGGASLPAAMDLTSTESSFNALVSVASLSEPNFERVTPSNADASYLIKKLEGTHTVGARMPFGGAALETELIDSIRQWIDAGAAAQ